MPINEKSIIEDRLHRIKNFIVLNMDFSPHNGFEEGKFGLSYFLFKYAIYFDDQLVFDMASELFDKTVEVINVHEPITFRRGLAGYGYGISSLVKDDIIEIDDNSVLEEIDKQLYEKLDTIDSLTNSDGLLGIGRYLAMASITGSNERDHKQVLSKIGRKLDYVNFHPNDAPFLIEFISSLVKLNIESEYYLHSLKNVLNNTPIPLLMPSDLLEYYRIYEIDLLKSTSLERCSKITGVDMRKLNSSSNALSFYASFCYLNYHFPQMNLHELKNIWFDILFKREDSRLVAGFDLNMEIQNFRMFNSYANFGLKLIKLLTLSAK